MKTYAKALLIAEPDVSQLTPVCTQAKMLNPNLEILVMVPTEEERQRMADFGNTLSMLKPQLEKLKGR